MHYRARGVAESRGAGVGKPRGVKGGNRDLRNKKDKDMKAVTGILLFNSQSKILEHNCLIY